MFCTRSAKSAVGSKAVTLILYGFTSRDNLPSAILTLVGNGNFFTLDGKLRCRKKAQESCFWQSGCRVRLISAGASDWDPNRFERINIVKPREGSVPFYVCIYV